MPHSPELVERMLKEAGFFDNVKSWFSGFLAPKPPATKEKKRALTRADAHFKAKDKDWDSFVDNASRKSFAKAVSNDGRADAKLKMHVDNINRLKTGKVLGTIKGTEGSRTARRDGSQSYKIIKLRGSDRLGCTCRDWRFKKSVAQPGEQVDCKHIRQFKQMNKTAAYEEGGSFTHDGQRYSLREAFRTARTKPTKQIDVDSLKWVLRHDRPDPKRLAAANLNAPVIVAPDRRGRPTVVDGLHRLSKAVQQGKKTLPAKVLTFGELKKEAAKVTSDLKPHQERVLRKLENSDGVIVAHRVGAGKTLTSIAAGVRSGAPMEIITPASLTKNYEKELKKHVKGKVKARITSYEKAVRRRTKEGKEAIEPGSFLVLDEAHRLRNQTLTRRTLKPESELAHKRLLLTGTALYNQPYDIAPLANIAAGETVLPADTMEFRRKFVREKSVSPGFINSLLGVQPGIRKELKNSALLRDALVGRIDVHTEADPTDFPEQIEERINVPMSAKQKEVYDAVMGSAPYSVRRKIREGLPPSKQESRMLNAFTTAGRQASLSPKPYVDGMSEQEEALHTPKIQEAARRLQEAKKGDRRFRGVVYSNYIEAGLKPYERALKKKKIKFNTLTGKLNAKQKARMVDEYNSGKVPVLLVSSSGTEGLDLKGTKMVQVLEPHWNNSKIDQVIGRGVRYKSHTHLPPAERKVQVQRYYSSLPKGFLGTDPGKSTEQWVQDRADDKTELANQMRRVFREASDYPIDPPEIKGHVGQRIAERAPGTTYEVSKIQARIPRMNLRRGQTYHVPLKGGKGYAVIGDVGPKHVVKTVLGPNMRPPGQRLALR